MQMTKANLLTDCCGHAYATWQLPLWAGRFFSHSFRVILELFVA
jgi:hypothetical protein